MAVIDIYYYEGLYNILNKGYTYKDPNRTGVTRTELLSNTLRHDFKDGFPILSLKKTFFKGAVAELLFFLSGSTDIRDLWKRGVNFWDKDWARFHGHSIEVGNKYKQEWKDKKWQQNGNYDMGRIYPAQYRNFNGKVDQFADVVRTLWQNPMSTSMVVNAWNPAELDKMALPPCHYGFQIVGRPLSKGERVELSIWDYLQEPSDEELDGEGIAKYGFEVHWIQRSTDYFLGTPINIQYYALLAILLEHITGHKALAIQADLKKVHLYDNQIEAATELLTRSPTKYEEVFIETSNHLKTIKEGAHYDGTNLDEILSMIEVSDFKLDKYESYERLKAEMLSRDAE